MTIELEISRTEYEAFATYALSRNDAPPGPAGRRFIALLKEG